MHEEGSSRNQTTWDADDELHLAQCWIHVSENSIVGCAMTGKTFWYQIVEEYSKHNPPCARTKDALSSKWTKLNNDCNKYNGIVNRLNTAWRSGENDNIFCTRSDDQFRFKMGKSFPSYKAWDFLQDKPKWLHPDPVVIGRRNKRVPDPVVDETIAKTDFDLN
ncbi:uncharacterized protein [Rutidosis leptorrhynchoides]|uniref:uncharacterized protein n=1 Tax=Rutidosis leptorrhynchoides TaxID=125765 RepID=UPI003A98D93C